MSSKSKAIKQLRSDLAVNPNAQVNDETLAMIASGKRTKISPQMQAQQAANNNTPLAVQGAPQAAPLAVQGETPPPVYSQGVQEFIQKMSDFEQEQQSKGYAVSLKDPKISQQMAEGDWQKLIEGNTSVSDLYALGHEFKTNKGNAAGTVFADPATQYRLRNEKGHDFIVSQGTGLSGLDEIYQAATNLSTTQKKKANWDVEMLNPTTGQWELVAHDDPKKPLGKTLLKVAAIAAPIVASIALPMLAPGLVAALGAGGLGLSAAAATAAAGAIGAAGASALVGTAQGKSIGKIAKGALISGAGAFAGGMVGPGLSSLGKTIGSPFISGLGTTLGAAGPATTNAAGDIIITASKTALPKLITTGLGAGAGGALGNINSIKPPSQIGPESPYQPINMNPISPTGGLPGGLPTGGLPTGGLTAEAFGPDDIVIMARKAAEKGITLDAFIKALPGAAVAGAGAATLIDPNDPSKGFQIQGENKPPPTVNPGSGLGAPADLLPDNVFDQAKADADNAEGEHRTDTPAPPSTLDDISKWLNYLKLAGTGIGLAGSLLGGNKNGSGSGSGVIPPGFLGGGTTAPVFTAQLPGANLPGVGAGATPRQMPQQDWFKYGQRPEQSFFTGIPQTYTPPAPGEEDEWDRLLRGFGGFKGFARGGEVSARGGALPVVGPGTGTSDDIPAYLSDGEYVIDAHTVAAIGGGNREEGFRKLDRMRKHVKRVKRAPRSLGVMLNGTQ